MVGKPVKPTFGTIIFLSLLFSGATLTTWAVVVCNIVLNNKKSVS